MVTDTILLKKYFAGLCSETELRQVVDFLSDPQSDITPLHALLDSEALEVTGEPLPIAMECALHQEIYQHIAEKRGFVRRLWHTAAAAAILLPVIFAWHFFVRKADTKSLTRVKGSTLVDGRWKTLENNGGDTKKATLPDGTQVWLSAYSSIEYQPELFGNEQRELRLQGEAFFDVAPDARHAFVVRHGAIATHVLGTSFNIEAYEEEAAIRVALVSGKVMVAPSGSRPDPVPLKELRPGQVLSYHKANGSFRIKPLFIKDEQAWKQGHLVFDDIPLKDALLRIQRKYGLAIHIPDNIDMRRMRVTAVFKSGDAQQVLQNLLFVHNLHFKIDKRNVTIY